ncbi:hypothetical protein CARUB_v10022678mg [Capsella rubella]|uniref:Histone-lysine N-methyltransferase n=1 Tax=Capsella rubella TaxID=81985 RepID=R0FUN3_9BRAS|nr:histone-lysine N-methyltransferase, H3 lysine-9 specific SUVH6 [Capsella rubella]EOA26261.1 hypothetical protein CARUB_v10022678mg [Capsella rubella]
MGVMENNMVNTETSKVRVMSNGDDSVEKRGLLQNGVAGVAGVGYRSDRMTGLKFKRRRVGAVRDFPPGCGTSFKSFTWKKTDVVKFTCDENGSVVADGDDKVESLIKEEQDDGKGCSDLGGSGALMVFASEDVSMAEAVEVKPLSICLPDGDVMVGSVTGESSNSEQDSGSDVSSSSGTENMMRDIVVYADDTSLGRGDLAQTEPLEIEMADVTAPKRSRALHRKKTKKGVAFRSARGSAVVRIPPSHPSGSRSIDSTRDKVKETLRLFHGVCRKVLQEDEAKPDELRVKKLRVDYIARQILKSKGKFLNVGVQILGNVPGVEVGDEFQYRMELNILGVHRPSQGGIDYMKVGKDLVATSIVASGGYDDHLDNSDVLTYTGQGGNVMQVKKKGQELKEPEDQKLVTGNLALANSIEKKTPVRVIRGKKKAALQSSSSAGGNYVYDGLYLVEKYWQEVGSHGKCVFKYKLRRMPGQAELSWRVMKKSTSKRQENVRILDISEGKERRPISAVNDIDEEKPPKFTYTVKMIYPDWCKPVPPKSCGCTTACKEASMCACVLKNNGEIPYNYDGAIVGAKPLIYECGPLCECRSDCYLRVTQLGIKIQLEIFKTKSRGWGVRSVKSIPIGSFICEYVGELLEDSEAERRIGNDEYLFDIGNRYDDSLAQGMSELMPGKKKKPAMEEVEETSGFTIDAATKGNVGRFINHSCSPNLYAQNVLYDHEDTRMPHVMFFAMDNIPPLQELTYHYNYAIDQVRDSKGNIKKKACFCGSDGCTRRLY